MRQEPKKLKYFGNDSFRVLLLSPSPSDEEGVQIAKSDGNAAPCRSFRQSTGD